MGEIKPKLVDRYELWRQRNPNTKPELDMVRMANAMAVRDNEELAIRAQASRLRRAASKDEAARRAQAEEERRRRGEPADQRVEYDGEVRQRQEAQAREAERRGYEEARRRHEAAKRREDEERSRVRADEGAPQLTLEGLARGIEMDRRRREEEEEEARRRNDDIARQKYEEEKRQERAQQEAASRRKSEELEHRRRLEESRRREQEGIVQRQREAEAEAEASRTMLRVTMPVLTPSSSSPSSSAISSTSFSSVLSSGMSSDLSWGASSGASSASSSTAQGLTPRQLDELPILPLESPTREDSLDPRGGRHHPQPQHAVPERAVGRRCVISLFVVPAFRRHLIFFPLQQLISSPHHHYKPSTKGPTSSHSGSAPHDRAPTRTGLCALPSIHVRPPSHRAAHRTPFLAQSPRRAFVEEHILIARSASCTYP